MPTKTLDEITETLRQLPADDLALVAKVVERLLLRNPGNDSDALDEIDLAEAGMDDYSRQLCDYEDRLARGDSVGMSARGEVVWCNFNPTIGSEQAGIRPAIIVQNDLASRSSPCTIAVPLTSKVHKAILPSHVVISAGVAGLSQDSVALCEQIRVIDKKRIIRVMGRLDAREINAIDLALRAALAL